MAKEIKNVSIMIPTADRETQELIRQTNDRFAKLTSETVTQTIQIEDGVTSVEGLQVQIDANGDGIADNSASIVTEQTVRANADLALASSVTTLSAEVDTNGDNITDNAASIVTEQIARADGDSALASDITTLEATVDGNTAAVVTEASARATADGFLEGSYGLQVAAGNVTTGMHITSSTGSGTDISDVTFNTLNFKLYNGSLGLAPFTVSGSDIAFTGNVTFSGVGTSELTNDAGFTKPSEVAAAVNNNVTTIDGGKITTGTITANEITANTITANEIINLGVTTDKIAANALTNINFNTVGSVAMTAGNYYNIVSVNSSNLSNYKGILSVSFLLNDGAGANVPEIFAGFIGNSTGNVWASVQKITGIKNYHTNMSFQYPITSILDSQYTFGITCVTANSPGSFVSDAVLTLTEFKK
ncbi:hypothetical protein N9064_00670 [bacterium]|nr:hypothetical protein [bacterium]